MRGLKGAGSDDVKFLRFFETVQQEAVNQRGVFFACAGDGRDLVLPDLEGEDLSGWLIPMEMAGVFEKEWDISNTESFLWKWSDFFCFAVWELDSENRIRIHFE